MSGFYPGPPYFFVCKNCGNKFQRRIKLGFFCPKCKSLRVVSDKLICR